MYKYKGYKCFSVPLKEFLMDRGLEYIVIGLDPKSFDTFWLFLRGEDLDEGLTEWDKLKKTI